MAVVVVFVFLTIVGKGLGRKIPERKISGTNQSLSTKICINSSRERGGSFMRIEEVARLSLSLSHWRM